MKFYSSMKAAAAGLNVHLSTLKTAKRLSCPAFDKAGRIDPKILLAWINDHADEFDEGGGRDVWELRKLKAEALKKEAEADRLRGNLVDLAKVRAEVADLTRRATVLLSQILVDELPPQLSGKSAESIRVEMKAVHGRICEAMAFKEDGD